MVNRPPLCTLHFDHVLLTPHYYTEINGRLPEKILRHGGIVVQRETVSSIISRQTEDDIALLVSSYGAGGVYGTL